MGVEIDFVAEPSEAEAVVVVVEDAVEVVVGDVAFAVVVVWAD